MYRRGMLVVILFCLAPWLNGCIPLSSTHRTVSHGDPKVPLGPANQTRSRPGDHVYFTNGRREKVKSVMGDHLVVSTSRNSEKTRWRNFILPTAKWSNSKYRGSQDSTAQADSLWPLKTGNTTIFRTQIMSTNKQTGEIYNGDRDWRCEVSGTESIALLSGDFDTFKVVCVRTDVYSGQHKQESIWYYAPEISQPVLKLNQYSSNKRVPSRYEVMAYQPSMRTFGKKARRAYWKFFRSTMESIPSGRERIWRDKASGGQLRLIPLKTLKQDDGTFCRQYRVSVSSKGENRRGAGIACRDKKSRWRIPKRIDPEKGVSFRK